MPSFQAPEGTPANRTENRIIHGDNLEALKSLLPEFEGKVKCIYIYIDLPYNTGNESCPACLGGVAQSTPLARRPGHQPVQQRLRHRRAQGKAQHQQAQVHRVFVGEQAHGEAAHGAHHLLHEAGHGGG